MTSEHASSPRLKAFHFICLSNLSVEEYLLTREVPSRSQSTSCIYGELKAGVLISWSIDL